VCCCANTGKLVSAFVAIQKLFFQFFPPLALCGSYPLSKGPLINGMVALNFSHWQKVLKHWLNSYEYKICPRKVLMARSPKSKLLNVHTIGMDSENIGFFCKRIFAFPLHSIVQTRQASRLRIRSITLCRTPVCPTQRLLPFTAWPLAARDRASACPLYHWLLR
jgi:hypothetical protein